jgi:hypothetical protein
MQIPGGLTQGAPAVVCHSLEPNPHVEARMNTDLLAGITPEGLDRMMAAVDEHTRLIGLTNEQLVLECLQSDASETDLVREMMTRLDPNWTDLTPEELAEEAKRDRARDIPEADRADPPTESGLDRP